MLINGSFRIFFSIFALNMQCKYVIYIKMEKNNFKYYKKFTKIIDICTMPFEIKMFRQLKTSLYGSTYRFQGAL